MQNKSLEGTGHTFERIRNIVRKVPKGKVATYGDIAKMSGVKDARIVGWILSKNHNPDVPCHRILKKGGFLVENYAFGDIDTEKQKLLEEGIIFKDQYQVDLVSSHWEPQVVY